MRSTLRHDSSILLRRLVWRGLAWWLSSIPRCAIESTARPRTAARHFATPTEMTLACAARGRMVPVFCLLAGGHGLLLIGSHQACSFLHGLVADLPHLLILLLRRERRVGADAFDLRTGIATDGPDPFHSGPLQARLLEAVFLAHGPAWSGRSCRLRIALRPQRSCEKQ